MIASRPIRTTTRRLLEGSLAEQAEKAGRRFDAAISPRRTTLQGLDMRIAMHEDELVTTRTELDRTEAEAAPTGNAHDQLQHRRQRRRHQHQQDSLRRRRAQLEQQLAEERERWATMIAEIEDLEQQKIAEAHRLRAIYTHAEAIYNRALIKRHPEGDTVRLMLDSSALRLPSWAVRPEDAESAVESK
jgi:Skp family chaperone for outer membrane proteins